jgi:hypothetical protein
MFTLEAQALVATLPVDGTAGALVLHPIMATMLGILAEVVVLQTYELEAPHLQTE